MKYDILKSKYVTDIRLKLQHSAKFNNKADLITPFLNIKKPTV